MLLAELGPQPTDVDVDRAGAAVVLVAPHPRQQDLAGEHLAGVLREELEQLVLHVREVERATGDRCLVGLEVERQLAVLDELGARRPPRAPQQVADPGVQLARVERREAEVVVQLVSQFQLAQLGAREQQQQWADRVVALAQGPAERPSRLQIVIGADEGAGPTVGRFESVCRLDRAGGAPLVTAEVERLGQFGGWRVGEDEQWFHGRSGHSERR